MLRRFDQKIIELIEKYCHRWQELTGLTNFWWARVASLVVFLMLLGAVRTTIQAIWLILIPIASLYSAYQVNSWGEYFKAEQHYLSGSREACSLTLMWRENVIGRSFGLLAVGLLFAHIPTLRGPQIVVSAILIVSAIAFTAEHYLRCAIPLPPGTSKVSQWMKEFRVGLAGAKAVPVPTRRRGVLFRVSVAK